MKRALAPSLVLATALTFSACTGSDEGETFNDADVMFAQMMIPHHEQAIEMSDVVLGKEGIDPQVTGLATQIKEAQGPEIEQLGNWLDEWGAEQPGGSAAMDHGDMDHGDMDHGDMDHGDVGESPMDGMMSQDDMRALEDAQGAEAGRLFLEQMIVHHEGAVEMARTEVRDGVHEGAVEMAGTVVDSQSQEIRTMQDLLDER